MRKKPSREIMVFSISFLDVIASALGAILILFIMQYKKTVNARVEVVRSEKRHVQCAEVLEHVFATELKDNRVTGDTVSVVERKGDFEVKTPWQESGTSTKKDALVNVAVAKRPIRVKRPKPLTKPEIAASKVRPAMRLTPKLPQKDPLAPVAPMTAMAPMVVVPMAPMTTPVPDPRRVAGTSPDGMQSMGITSPTRAQMTPARPGAAMRPRPRPAPRPRFRLPPKPKRKALATCVTQRKTVAVEFYDYDEPDGDTILVTFNGRGATRLKLHRHARRRFYFKLNQGKYNIIRIKNISNGFYPINTANVYIAGCGRARWKMKQVGVTRLIYIYRR